MIKYHNTPGDTDSGSDEINLPYYYEGGPFKVWLVWKDKLLMTKALVPNLKGTNLPKDFSQVTQKQPLTWLPWILVHVL